MNKKNAYLIATFFGVGYAKKAPGTCGSLATLPLAILLCYFLGTVGILLGMAVTWILGVLATKEVLKETEHDPGMIVIDEVLGQLTAFLAAAPVLHDSFHLWWYYPIGFAFFRLFDIAKIGPVKWADEKITNAYGVMLDDLFAGLFAAVVLFLVHYMATR